MRLLVINWLDPANPQRGGAETHLAEIFGRLASRGHQVTLLASGWGGSKAHEVTAGIEIHRVGGRHSFAVLAPLYHRRVLASRPFDLVIEDLNKIPLHVPAWTDRRVVLIAHHLFGSSAFGAAPIPIAAATFVLERTLPLSYRGVPVQAVSESTAEDLCRHGLRRQDITVIHNGVTPGLYRRSGAARAPEPMFVYVGRLQAYKRVDLILRAVARLRRVVGSVRLIVAGRGDQEMRLQRLARELGIGECVEFVGFVTEEAKRELFIRAWANVVTSSKEGWGIPVLEAAAAGTPTVASHSPGLCDAVRDGVTGVLVPHGDVAALADALGRLVVDRSRAESLGRAAHALAEGSTWERAADQTEAHLLKVVEGGAGRRGQTLPWRSRRQVGLATSPRSPAGAVQLSGPDALPR